MKKYKLIISIIIFIIITSGTAIVLIVVNKSTHNKLPDIVIQESNSKDQIKKKADKLKQDALEAVRDDNSDKALSLLKQAQVKYTEIDDQINLTDVSSLINLVETHKDVMAETKENTIIIKID